VLLFCSFFLVLILLHLSRYNSSTLINIKTYNKSNPFLSVCCSTWFQTIIFYAIRKIFEQKYSSDAVWEDISSSLCILLERTTKQKEFLIRLPHRYILFHLIEERMIYEEKNGSLNQKKNLFLNTLKKLLNNLSYNIL
jgi:hypothetical protein